MAAGNRGRYRWLRIALLAGAASCALVCTVSVPARAQTQNIESLEPKIPEDAKLLLAANELVYNKDTEKVIARGAVQINYGGYQLVARQVVYDQKTGRLSAVGDIELIEPSGNKVYAQNLDLSDDFANGFVNALRIETTDLTKIAATSGERVNDEEMILNKAVYTACTPCATNPTHRSLWQIKAERIVQNGKTHTIRLEHAQFEMFGKPIAYLPTLTIPDHTVKRKSGFLFPQFSYAQKLGLGVGVPYYFAIAPDMDATVAASGYTRQGFLLEGEFRKRFHSGLVTLRAAGIDQMNTNVFTEGTTDANVTGRGMLASTGEFKINPRWAFGWDAMIQTDNNFSRTYDLDGLDDRIHTNQIYLTGLGERNFFDLRGFYFDVQDADDGNKEENKQAIPQTLDYDYIAPQPIFGGELSVTSNITNIHRDRLDSYSVLGNERFRGLEGGMTRLTSEIEWKRQFVAPGGLVLTPLLAARGDAYRLDMTPPGAGYAGNYTNADDATRAMLTAGLEARYPILATTEHSSHIFEPIGQIYARPDEDLAGGLPNEDAQSFVFDATSLFDRDKFSGFDRVEGGTRANVGMRYTGSFDNGYTLRSIVGQSFQLAGKNSFASPDLVNAGANSGLESDASDYVGMAGIDMPNGIALAASARLDRDDLSLSRTDATIGFENHRFQSELTYTRIAAQPLYGLPSNNDEIQSAAALKFKDYWSVFGSITYDINDHNVSRNGIGLTYDDRDTVFSIVYEQTRDSSSSVANDWSIGARLSFRTLGDIQVGDTDLQGFD
ncbi:LPS-assembly protein LptD [Sinorhizobium sp. BG8]|uniref:LPS-assembly protein LptD n=1 Tax=Sinorhizobium sp. BG8 TaxID=2613773 RepID=UPI00193D2429|nr:LPS-assembly protein LptD [Sinorhizobium sp. BG8]QRM54880.1 LPS-assembly protein LptD [Sinorhizobium sp. BG8]